MENNDEKKIYIESILYYFYLRVPFVCVCVWGWMLMIQNSFRHRINIDRLFHGIALKKILKFIILFHFCLLLFLVHVCGSGGKEKQTNKQKKEFDLRNGSHTFLVYYCCLSSTFRCWWKKKILATKNPEFFFQSLSFLNWTLNFRVCVHWWLILHNFFFCWTENVLYDNFFFFRFCSGFFPLFVLFSSTIRVHWSMNLERLDSWKCWKTFLSVDVYGKFSNQSMINCENVPKIKV